MAVEPIPLYQIRTDPLFALLQVHLNPAHVDDLKLAYERQHEAAADVLNPVPPVVVWHNPTTRDPSRPFILLDGHHRMEAFRKARGTNAKITTWLFEGNRKDAFRMAVSANTATALPLNHMERADMAWKAVREFDMTKSEIMTSAGVGKGSVDRMRRALRTIQEFSDKHKKTKVPTKWLKARDLATQITEKPDLFKTPDDDRTDDVAQAKKAAKIAGAIRKAVGPVPQKNVDAFFLALEEVMGDDLIKEFIRRHNETLADLEAMAAALNDDF